MNGCQNQLKISQKIKRNDSFIQQIQNFENYPSFETGNLIQYYEFSQKECFSLGQLIESMQYNFIKIYKGQMLIIILEIMKHLENLHINQITHGKLTPQNIIIQLTNDANCKLNILQTKFTIKQIYFINYRLVEDVNYVFDYFQDFEDIIMCFTTFIQALQDNSCQLLNYIVNTFQNLKKDKTKDYVKCLVDFMESLNYQYVDNRQQKLKPLDQIASQNIKCNEVQEYNWMSNRYRSSTLILNLIDDITKQEVNQEIKRQNNKNYEDNCQQYIYDTSKLKEDEKKIYNVFEQILKQQMLRTIWNYIGSYLEFDNFQDYDQSVQKVLEIINQTKNQILNNHLALVIKEFNNVDKINNQIKQQIEENYKFEIFYDVKKAQDLFIIELQLEANNYDFNNIQIFINKVNSNLKQELQEHYNSILMIQILELIDDLI